MKKIFSIISVTLFTLGLVTGISSCAGDADNSGSVSFVLSKELVHAASEARLLRSDIQCLSFAEKNTDGPGILFDQESESEYYSVTCSLSGDFSDSPKSQSEKFSMAEWETLANTGSKQITFDEIPVGSTVTAKIDISLIMYDRTFKLITGTSDSKTIEAGNNSITLTAHGLAAYNLYMQKTDQSGNVLPISSPKSVVLYALETDSDNGKIIANYVKNGVENNAYSIYNTITKCTPLATYTSLDSSIFSDSYELTKGKQIYFFSLVTDSEDNLYFGYSYDMYPTETDKAASVTIETASIGYAYIYLTAIKPDSSEQEISGAFFPSSYSDERDHVVAWYASKNISSDETKIFALYLFENGNFIATKRTIKDSSETREIEMAGSYKLDTANDYTNNTGIGNVSIGGKTQSYAITITDGLFVVKDVDTTWKKQSGSVPEASEETTPVSELLTLKLCYRFQKEKDSTVYVANDKFPDTTLTIANLDDGSYRQAIYQIQLAIIQAGYKMSSEKESDDDPVEQDDGTYALTFYYDIADLSEIFTATSTKAVDSAGSSDKYNQTGFKFTVYDNLSYIIKYSDASGSVKDVIVSKGIYDAGEKEGSLIITETAYLADWDSISSGKLTSVTSPQEKNVSIFEGAFTLKSTNGLSVTFVLDGESTSSGITVTLDKTTFTDEGKNITVTITKDDEKGSVTLRASSESDILITSYIWWIEGTPYEGANEYVITAEQLKEFEPGNKNVTLVVTINGETYSVTSSFTITK
ncbi:MAG: hypothetical protein IJS09_10595 [Treponema sp.]|nr:hypothetical protein [Treponema sp.]